MMNRADLERADLAILTGPDAGEILSLAYEGRRRIVSWVRHSVHHRPGASVSVGYSVVFDDGADAYAVASTARIPAADLKRAGARTVHNGKRRVHVWEHPHDPALPALELACDPHQLSEYFGEPVELELLGYRPTRRAVLHVMNDKGLGWYAKVLRPVAIGDYVSRLDLMARADIPAPRLVHVDERGLAVTTSVPGVPLQRRYASGTAHHRILDNLEEALDALPRLMLGFPRRPAWMDRCEQYAQAASNVLPELADRCHQVAADIRELEAEADMGPLVPTHGDLYEANIMVDPDTGELSGLIDVDGVGPGHRVHDWGCLLGHLSVLHGISPRTYPDTEELLEDWYRRLAATVDPVALCASAAGVVISLVAGARRTRRRNWHADAVGRLEQAEAWVRRGQKELAD